MNFKNNRYSSNFVENASDSIQENEGVDVSGEAKKIYDKYKSEILSSFDRAISEAKAVKGLKDKNAAADIVRNKLMSVVHSKFGSGL